MAINIKTPAEIEIMRQSGRILAATFSMLMNNLKPGISTQELDKIAEDFIRSQGATPACKGYKGYPATLCTSVNDEVVHTIPSSKQIKDGDIITLDCVVNYQGYLTDSAITCFVGNVNQNTQNFVFTVRNILQEAIKLVKPGIRLGDISNYIETETKKAGFHIIKELIGHGIGKQMHEEPEVPNYGKKGSGPVLKPGMTICIEPIVGMNTKHIGELADHWTIVTQDGTLACQEEHTVLITDTGFEVLTLRDDENWL